jgi:tellurite resistance protein
MNGRTLAIIGLGLIIAGAFVLYLGYSTGGWGLAAGAWAAILAGAVALMTGASRFMGDFMAPQKSEESAYGEAEIRLLIQSMGAVAAADGKIADAEIATIAQIHERMLGLSIEHKAVSRILGDISPKFDIKARLSAEREKLSPIMRQLIVKSCCLVMMSDQKRERAEMGKLHEIGMALGFSREEVADIIAMAGV